MVQPADVGAPALNVDSTVNFVIFNDPNYLAGVSYCYFVFRGWIDPAKLSPDDEALNSSGFSILNEEISAYQNWLDKNETGKSCKARIEKDSGVPVANLKNLLGKHSALIGLNPLASVHTGHLSYSSVLDDLALTLNHERVHAYQVLCPDLEKWGQAQWNLLPQNEKDKFSVVYPAYNWKDLKIAGREYVAFSYEGKPTKLLERLNGCKIKP